MAEQGQGFGTPVRHDADGGVLLDWTREVHEPAVEQAGQSRVGEVRRDPGRHVEDPRAGWHAATRAIRKSDGDLTHGKNDGRAQLSALNSQDAWISGRLELTATRCELKAARW